MSKQSQSLEFSFDDLLSQKQWEKYSSYISEAPKYYAEQLNEDFLREKQLRIDLRNEILEKNYLIYKYSRLLGKASDLLFRRSSYICE